MGGRRLIPSEMSTTAREHVVPHPPSFRGTPPLPPNARDLFFSPPKNFPSPPHVHHLRYFVKHVRGDGNGPRGDGNGFTMIFEGIGM